MPNIKSESILVIGVVFWIGNCLVGLLIEPQNTHAVKASHVRVESNAEGRPTYENIVLPNDNIKELYVSPISFMDFLMPKIGLCYSCVCFAVYLYGKFREKIYLNGSKSDPA